MITMWVLFWRTECVAVCPMCYRLVLVSELAWVCPDWLVSVLCSRQCCHSPQSASYAVNAVNKDLLKCSRTPWLSKQLQKTYLCMTKQWKKNWVFLIFFPLWDRAANSASICCAHHWRHFNEVCLLSLCWGRSRGRFSSFTELGGVLG